MIETLVKPYSQETHDNGTQSTIYQLDCIEGMKQYPNKHFDLAVVDPPYGIDFGNFNRTNKDSFGNRTKANKYKNGNWDNERPNIKYFTELQRVSKEQIIWGGNYFSEIWTSGCKCFIFWYKQNPVNNFSDGELAWTSYDKPAMCFDYRYYGNLEGKTSASDKFHPTQKPVALYDWIFKNYANQTDKILDTHLGSGSSRIAAWKHGLDFTGYEIDSDYLRDHEKRFQNFIAQKTLF